VKPYPKGNEDGWPGWKFDRSYPNATSDKLFGSEYLHEIYFKADKDYKGRYSVPALWDTRTNTMVNTVHSIHHETRDGRFADLVMFAGKCRNATMVSDVFQRSA
jgi:glutathionyl-hydroquinone reductase